MAVLTNPVLLSQGGGSGEPHYAVLSFQKVTAADTYDMATLSGVTPAFSTVTHAFFACTSNRTATPTLATIAGTVVTVVGAGIASDSCLLFVVGE